MKIVQLFNSYRFCLNSCRLQTTIKCIGEVRHYCELTPPETLRHYELGNFSSDLKPYLVHKKKKRQNLYLEERYRNEHPVIKCKNSQLNHYRNRKYDKFTPIPLASEQWRSHKSVGDYFTIKIYPDGYKEKYSNLTKDFIDSGLDMHIVDVLKANGIETMSEVQELAISEILDGHNCLIAAETGCGKTLAYLLPIIQQIFKWKKEGTERQTNSPYVVIVTPNRELTEQIREVVKLFRTLGIESQKIMGGSVGKKLNNPVIAETDILVTTPIVVHKMHKAGLYKFDDVRQVVLDEADTLLDDSFNQYVTDFLRIFQVRGSLKEDGTQIILVSATMPTSIPEILGDIINIDQMRKITTKELHLVMPHVKQKFLRVLQSTKPAHLLRHAKNDFENRTPMIIFCNKVDTCNWVSEFLAESGISNVNLSGSMLLKHRKGKFKQFQEGEETVLVTTSLASRGLDTKQVKHVMNYEFPGFMAEYIHRCGRTGRLGSNAAGRVTNLISKKNEVLLVHKIELSVRCNVELENVNANIKRIIKFRRVSPIEKKLGVAE